MPAQHSLRWNCYKGPMTGHDQYRLTGKGWSTFLCLRVRLRIGHPSLCAPLPSTANAPSAFVVCPSWLRLRIAGHQRGLGHANIDSAPLILVQDRCKCKSAIGQPSPTLRPMWLCGPSTWLASLKDKPVEQGVECRQRHRAGQPKNEERHYE